MGRIFINGDTHRENDIGKLNTQLFPIQKQLTKDDYVIIVGDFGACWYGGSNIEQTNPGYEIPPRHRGYVGKDDYLLDWYEKKNFTTLFIDGNHENHKLLNTFAVERWHGGFVHRIRPSVIHLMRGQVYEIAGSTFFTMGGASSVDRMHRLEDVSWWSAELPSNEEYEQALDNLDQCGWKVDYVLTHCCGSDVLCQMRTHHPQSDKLTQFLMSLEGRLEYKMWYFGHHHIDRQVDRNHRALYEDVVEL